MSDMTPAAMRGEWHGNPPDLGSDRIIVRCYACAALEEAEAITREAADPRPDPT